MNLYQQQGINKVRKSGKDLSEDKHVGKLLRSGFSCDHCGYEGRIIKRNLQQIKQQNGSECHIYYYLMCSRCCRKQFLPSILTASTKQSHTIV